MESSEEHLAKKHCSPCTGATRPLTGDALQVLVQQLHNGWHLVEEHHLEKAFSFPNFRDALAFTNKVGEIAETEGHHPDIHLSFGKVYIELWTHKCDGLTENDFVLAAKIDQMQQKNFSNSACF